MGDALSASLGVLEAALSAEKTQDPRVAGAFGTVQHIRDVLTGKAASFDPSTIRPMLAAASTPRTAQASNVLTTSLLDEASPTMPSSTFSSLSPSVVRENGVNPIRRAPSYNAKDTKPQDDTRSRSELSQAPAASNHTQTDDILMGRYLNRLELSSSTLKSWGSPSGPQPPSASIFGSSRKPDTIRPSSQSSSKLNDPLATQGSWTSNAHEEADPLGVLF